MLSKLARFLTIRKRRARILLSLMMLLSLVSQQSIAGAIDLRTYLIREYSNSQNFILFADLPNETQLVSKPFIFQFIPDLKVNDSRSVSLANSEFVWSESFLVKINLTFFVSFSLIVFLFGAIGVVAFLKHSPSNKTAILFIQSLEHLQVLRIMMAVVMVYAITMLTLAKAISSEAAVPVITAIISFTLGGLVEARRQVDTSNELPNKDKKDDI